MAWVKGQSGNPLGMPKQTKQLLNKVRNSLNMAVDGLGDKEKDGATAMAELITEALRNDVVGTLSKLSGFFPKDINIDVQHTRQASTMTDDELASIIAERARSRFIESKEVDGQVIDNIEVYQEEKGKGGGM